MSSGPVSPKKRDGGSNGFSATLVLATWLTPVHAGVGGVGSHHPGVPILLAGAVPRPPRSIVQWLPFHCNGVASPSLTDCNADDKMVRNGSQACTRKGEPT